MHGTPIRRREFILLWCWTFSLFGSTCDINDISATCVV